MIYSISEIIKKTGELETEESKMKYLLEKQSIPLRQILKYTYDTENVEFLIPSSRPTWKKNPYIGVEGMLYKEARRLKIFIKGGGYDNLSNLKREMLFISMLEDVNNDDAELLVHMITQKPFAGISFDLIKKCFPSDYMNKSIDIS